MRKFIFRGKTYRTVCIKTGDGAAEKHAGLEFLRYMGKIGIPEGGGVSVNIRIDETLPNDSFRISFPECMDNDKMEIIGGNGRGVIYGVYRFFEKYAGMRFFTPDLESLGEGDIIVNEEFAYTPVFEYRRCDWHCGKDVDWSLKNGINNWEFLPEDKGGYVAYGGFVHTFAKLTGTDQYKEQPCLSDPEVLRKVITGVREILTENPHVSIVSVSQNDNFNHCTCAKCAAVDAEEGSHAGSLIRFVNKVAEDIGKDYPHIIIDTLAYNYSQKAPAITKPLPNVCIRMCPIFACFSHPIDDISCPKNAEFFRDVQNWCKVSDRLYVWDYVSNFCYYVPPFPNFGVMRENMRIYAEHNVKGMYPEGTYNSEKTGEFGELRCYLLAQLMWNPYMSATEYYDCMDEFLAAYYGEGWRYIRAYIDWTESAAKQNHMTLCRAPFEIISKDKWEIMEDTIENWWNKAEALAGNRLEFVKRSRLQWEYVRLMLHPNEKDGEKLLEAIENNNIQWDEGRHKADRAKLGMTPNTWVR